MFFSRANPRSRPGARYAISRRFRLFLAARRILFSGRFLLSFTAVDDPVPEVQLILTVPESTVTLDDSAFEPSEITEISIPFRFVGNAVPDGSGRASFVRVAEGGDEYFFTAPPDALIDPVNEKIVLRPAASGRAIRYVEAVAGNPSTVHSCRL